MNKLEKTILGVASQESVMMVQSELNRFKNNIADEMVGVHHTVGMLCPYLPVTPPQQTAHNQTTLTRNDNALLLC